jgi:hypothetical protein
MVFVLSVFDAAGSIAFMMGRAPVGWSEGACNAQALLPWGGE